MRGGRLTIQWRIRMMDDGRKKVQKLYGDRLEEQIWIHRCLECRGQVKQLEQHNKRREQTDWLEELGLRLWKQSRTWSEAESRTWKF